MPLPSSDRPPPPNPASATAAPGRLPPPESMRSRRPSSATGRVTLILIVACVAIYLWSLQKVDPDTLAALAEKHPGIDDITARLLPFFISLFPFASPNGLSEVRNGEIWRLFTPAFIHFSVPHLVFNMLGLQTLGSAVEAQNGRRFYLVLITILALTTNLIEYAAHGPYFGGMSGVVYGLFSYIWLRSVCDHTSGFYMPRQTIVIALVWFVACFTGLLGPIANVAHTAGLVLGAVWGAGSGWWASRRSRAM